MGLTIYKDRLCSKVIIIPALLATILFVGACSSPKSRIEEKPEVFTALEPQDQMKIQNGDIDIGYTEDMVYLAKGKPKQTSQRREHGKTILVWRYPRPRYGSGAAQPATGLTSPYGYPNFGPQPSVPTPLFYDGPGLTIEFENGKVRRVVE